MFGSSDSTPRGPQRSENKELEAFLHDAGVYQVGREHAFASAVRQYRAEMEDVVQVELAEQGAKKDSSERSNLEAQKAKSKLREQKNCETS